MKILSVARHDIVVELRSRMYALKKIASLWKERPSPNGSRPIAQYEYEKD